MDIILSERGHPVRNSVSRSCPFNYFGFRMNLLFIHFRSCLRKRNSIQSIRDTAALHFHTSVGAIGQVRLYVKKEKRGYNGM
ncbi:MAG: hypothetical protein C4527_07795 [Candidatus Omnitrophota bacterium]|nr:MAG: hypothetical protein C4527_07795 [Candidatus Omnitrophota bacterium]